MGGPKVRSVAVVWLLAIAALAFAVTGPGFGEPDTGPLRVVSTLVRTPSGGWQYPDGSPASADLAEVLGSVVERGESVPFDAPGLDGAEAVPLNDGTVLILAPVTSLPPATSTTARPSTSSSEPPSTPLPTVTLTIDITTTTTTEVGE